MRLSDTDTSIPFRLFGVVLVFLLGIVCGNCWGGIARAQVNEPTAVQLALALDVARTAVNEASLSASPRDVDLVYEATRYHGRDDRSRLRWLRRHSACTNPRGDCNRDGVVDDLDFAAASARPGNASWSRHLRWNDARPANLVGRWRAAWWQRVRDRALARVMRNRPTGVCGGVRIVTWGRRSDFDSRPNLVPVECGAANLGGARLARSLRVRRAALALATEVR